MRTNIYYIVIILIICSFSNSCKKDKDSDPNNSSTTEYDSINYAIVDLLNEWYYWNEYLPNDINLTRYSTPQELLDDIKYEQYDKWSFVEKSSDVDDMIEGNYFGYGFYVGWDNDVNMRAFIVYEDSEAYSFGLRRGDRIIKMNGVNVIDINDFDFFFSEQPGTLSIEFSKYDNNYSNISTTIEISKKEFKMNSVLHKSIINVGADKVGYLVFESFMNYALDELIEALNYFYYNSVDEVIIDLRYNGGGNPYLSDIIASYILPKETAGSKLYTIIHNEDQSYYDTIINVMNCDYNMDLDRVFVITSEYSASASELLINCLEPYMNVIKIGRTTHGKPVGMYVFSYNDWDIAPVTFESVNANDEGGYYNGISPNKSICDGFMYPWGNENEYCLQEAIYYINNGYFSSNTCNNLYFKSSTANSQPELEFRKSRNLQSFYRKMK